MKDLLNKLSLTQKILIGLGIFAIIAVIIVATFVIINNNPNKAIKKYCDIMVKGNYGDILDVAYLPDSEFITKEKIEEAKQKYFERMKNSNITSCTYTKANENDETISYKLTINGNRTDTMSVDKKTKKVLIDNLYETKRIETYADTSVTIDGKELSNPKIEDGKEIYEVILLSNVNYEIKIKPKNGINDETLNDLIKKESEDSSKIALINRNTDLENMTDTLTFSREYDDGILSLTGSFDIVYKFTDDNAWEYDKKENENYQKTWNISGIWEDVGTSSSRRLEIKEEDGKVTGTYKYVSTIGIGTNNTFNYTSGTFSDGKIEMTGEYTYSWAFSTKTDSTKFIGTINSKEKTMTISINPNMDSGMSLAGKAVLTKK